ncbi:glycosyltransferase family 2 protein [Candidatus Woesebacteria bacterium]|nr:glycosyltransferase family 2 protein [Candidatus Woesebacteria bacterium]HNV45323.1 glycosyltransferase family 2 protein [Candidatus Woesebacteria bacterium]HOA12104.1 glycosyltransferase family 2 protein [Candidatus Woesebacteria bacterium]HOC07603.1 glycosyltransferase family 2 protein [Candidatus Woesebacteria bacterium]HOI05211.1 glycosyltransferase family 2 protein [Candidatus Woesebacteria bacterium]
MSRAKITAVIIAKNEEAMLPACLETLAWCDEILLIDCASTDKTTQVAEKYGARVIGFDHPSFAKIREKGLESVTTDYLFYVDADERVTPALAKEILVHLENQDCQVMNINRENICYGRKFHYGNWQNDQVIRVFHKDSLKGWQGEIHESPIYSGHVCQLSHKLIHLTHRSTQENLIKSANWTIKEASLLAASEQTKPVTFFTILRKGFMEFYRRAFKYQGRKDGLAGLIEALVQGINRMLVYIQVWELQQKPSLADRYHKQEMQIKKLWKTEGASLKL